MPMKNPPHLGAFVLRECIEALGLSVTEAASALGVSRRVLCDLVTERRGYLPIWRAAASSLRRQPGDVTDSAGSVRPGAHA